MTGHEFTPDQIVDGITRAIREQDFHVIPGLIKLLAVQDPSRAQDVLDAIDLASFIGTSGSRP